MPSALAAVSALWGKWSELTPRTKLIIAGVLLGVVLVGIVLLVVGNRPAAVVGGGALVAGAVKVARDQAAAREKAARATAQAKAASRTAGQIVEQAKAKAEADRAAVGSMSDDALRSEANRLL